MYVDTGVTSTACWWSKADSEWRKHSSDLPESYRLEERDKTCKLDNERGSHRLNICVSLSPKFICWNLAPQNDGVSGRWLGREGEWGWMNPTWMGLVPSEQRHQPAPSALLPCEDAARRHSCPWARKQAFTWCHIFWHLLPSLWCYSSLNRPRQRLSGVSTRHREGEWTSPPGCPQRSQRRRERWLTTWGRGEVSAEGKGWVLLATQWGSVNWQEKQPLAWIPKGHHRSQIRCHSDIASSPSSPTQQRSRI